MKFKRMVITMSLLMLGFASGAVYGASKIEKVEAYLRKDYQVFVDGSKVDVGPVLVYNDSSYLPLAKIGELLKADVKWSETNKGIYVNPRFPGQPDPIVRNPNYTPITMSTPQGYKVTYQGSEYPVLGIVTSDYKTYYRDSDIQRMGIDTRGLHKAEEQRTKELYVTEAEISKVWKEQPKFNYAYGPLVIGNTDPEKLKVVQEYIDGLPAMYKAMNMKDPLNPQMDYYTIPYVYVIDVLPNDEFKILGLENSNFKLYWLKLKKNIVDKWYRSEEKITDLGSMYPQYQY